MAGALATIAKSATPEPVSPTKTTPEGERALANILAILTEKESPKMTDHTVEIEKLAATNGTSFESAFVSYVSANPGVYDEMNAAKPVAKAATPAPAFSSSEFDRWFEKEINARVEKWNESRVQAVAKIQDTHEFQQRYGQNELLKAQEAAKRV
ncbi:MULTISPECIES: hypothetical protein [unclassified Mesorhizobium]|uniref:hypothetical protein n=1 Tax=unclassified Mesorhizobium TaxID=325217 RepID=UPI003014B882